MPSTSLTTRRYDIHFLTSKGGISLTIETPDDFVVGPEHHNVVAFGPTDSNDSFILEGPGKVIRVCPHHIHGFAKEGKREEPAKSTFTVSESGMKRLVNDYSKIAQEPIRVEIIKGALYVFGSELACLRLHLKMPAMVKYSTNLTTWYYCRELP